MINNPNKYIIAFGPNPAWQKALFFKKFTAGAINRAEEMQSFPSGKGVNFCRAAAQWNEFSTLLIQFAGGDTGKLLCAGLAEEKIEHRTIEAEFSTRTSVTCLCRTSQTMTEVIEPSHPLSAQAIEDFHRML
ncbi:MAG: PfkB family carbohydrate kinase, partial [Victivallaceae bacterium]